jgi:hypothetical protein
VCEDLRFETQFADGFAVLARLLTGGWGGEFNIVGAELIEGLGDLNLFVGVKVGIGEPVTVRILLQAGSL